MTIQISVTIWTILCFAALYVILRFVLFKPLLEVMDRRKQKIEDAKKAENDARQQLEQAQQQKTAQRKAQLQQAQQQAREDAEAARQAGKRQLEEAKKERAAAVAAFREKTEADCASELEGVGPSMQALADRFLTELFRREP